ncbi:MAG: 2-dehydropantoate 2-reductase N-terminal domain-containing protein [Hyphomicrobiales bacterium]|nr:2-dehydropantoate 2-reductase N-terminal domain-containing protein [Hyphomicrobiales bacterium]
MNNKKIAILGTGANGSCVSADLVSNGFNVKLIDQWPEHVEKMRKDGLKIEMPNRTLEVKVDAYHLCDIATFAEKFDIVLLFMKAYDTAWACELIKPYLEEDGILVGVQNCMMAEQISGIVGANRTIGCVAELSSELFDPGLVKRNTPPEGTWFGLGALAPDMLERIPEIEEVLKFAGKVGISDEILSAKWMKLIVNVMGMGIKAIGDLRPAEAFELDGMRDVMLKAGEEALKVGEGLGYKTVPIMGLSKEEIDTSNRVQELLLDTITKHVGPTALNTVLQDHRKGRLSEVDLINGWVSKGGKQLGIKTPINDKIVEITKKIHQGELKSSKDLVIEVLNSVKGKS